MASLQSIFKEACELSNVLISSLYQNLIARDDKANIPMAPRSDVNVECMLIFIWAVCIVVFMGFSRRYMWEPLGGVFLGTKSVADKRRFADSFTELVFYSLFTWMGLNIYLTHDWVWPSNKWWDGPYTDEMIMRNDLRALYLFDTSRYMACLVSVLFMEHKRKDFAEMTIHHCATILVTVVAYFTDHSRIGSMVKVTMDPADVPLHLAKAFNYGATHRKSKVMHFLADRLFEVFAVVFFFTRLGIFGYIMYSSTFEGRIKCSFTPIQNLGLSMLYIIYALQIYWMGLIVNMAMKMARGDKLKDSRSDSEDSEDEADDKKKIARKKKKSQ